MSISTDIVIQQGALFLKLCTVMNDVTGLPFNLSNYTPRGQLRDLKKNLIAEFDCSLYGSDDGNMVLFKLDPDVTSAITYTKSMKYTVEVEDNDDATLVYRIAEGNATLSLDYCLPVV